MIGDSYRDAQRRARRSEADRAECRDLQDAGLQDSRIRRNCGGLQPALVSKFHCGTILCGLRRSTRSRRCSSARRIPQALCGRKANLDSRVGSTPLAQAYGLCRPRSGRGIGGTGPEIQPAGRPRTAARLRTGMREVVLTMPILAGWTACKKCRSRWTMRSASTSRRSRCTAR